VFTNKYGIDIIVDSYYNYPSVLKYKHLLISADTFDNSSYKKNEHLFLVMKFPQNFLIGRMVKRDQEVNKCREIRSVLKYKHLLTSADTFDNSERHLGP
jgi:hypothetical protein